MAKKKTAPRDRSARGAVARLLGRSWAVTLAVMVGALGLAAASGLGSEPRVYRPIGEVYGLRLGATADELRDLVGAQDPTRPAPVLSDVGDEARDRIGARRIWFEAVERLTPVRCALDLDRDHRLARTTCRLDRPVARGEERAALEALERELVARWGPPYKRRGGEGQGAIVQWAWATDEARLNVFAQIVPTAPGQALHVTTDAAALDFLWALRGAGTHAAALPTDGAEMALAR